MFESSEFLNQYLPYYFQKVVSKFPSAYSPQKASLMQWKAVSQFIKFSHTLYVQLGIGDNFSTFLKSHFSHFDFSITSKQSIIPSQLDNQKKSKIIETLESKINKISLSFIKLYIKILQIHFDIEDKKLAKQKIVFYSEQISNACNKARFQYELNRFQMENLREYDQYISNVFKMVFQLKISENMEQIIRNALLNQCSNISDAINNEIQSYFKSNKKTNQQQIQQNCIMIGFKELLGKGKQKSFKKLKVSPNKIRKMSVQSIKSSKSQKQATPSKKNLQKFKDPYSPARMNSLFKIRKSKPISKQRTIYFQRKNIHVPKIKDWLEKMDCIVSQSTIASFQKQKRTQAKPFKFDLNQSKYDEHESILVGSTPKKQSKKMNSKMISQKLDF